MTRSRRCGTRWIAGRWSLISAVVLPLGPAVLWIPVRSQLPNVDVALALVLAVAACGVSGRSSNVRVAATVAAGAFAFFDTQPYEHWVVSRQPDLETLVVLAVVSLVAGELAVRAVRLYVEHSSGADALHDVRALASLVASGAELVEVIATAGDHLVRLLHATAWTYEAGESAAGRPVAARDGRVLTRAVGLGAGRPVQPAHGTGDAVQRRDVDVPVSGMGRVLGRYVMGSAGLTDRETLLVALTLADQVGAALIAQAPETTAVAGEPDRAPTPLLRVLE